MSRTYEKLVRDIYSALVRHEGRNDVEVQHDVRVEGQSGQKHQIDVFWELQVARETYRTVVECKRWNKAVDVGVVRDMVGLLADLPPGTTGVIVGMMGFQEGAFTLAEHHRIRLVKVGVPVKHLHFSMTFVSPPIITNVGIQVDEEAARALLASSDRNSIRDQAAATLETGFLVDEGGQPKTILDLFDVEAAGPGCHRVPTPGLLLPTEIGHVPVVHLDVHVEQPAPLEEELRIETGETARAVFDSLLDGHKLILRDDGTIQPMN